MHVITKVLVVGLLAAIAQLSASDARAREQSVAATGPCAPYEDCTFPSPAAARAESEKPDCDETNANTFYPHETDCNKYYVCRTTTSSTTFGWVKSSCYKDRVFNPDENKCDLPENVSGCEK